MDLSVVAVVNLVRPKVLLERMQRAPQSCRQLSMANPLTS